VRYKSGYKYQLAQTEVIYIGIIPDSAIKTEYIELDEEGYLTTIKGYCWDGASWAIDTDTFMQASLAHDALSQLIREGKLDKSYKDNADMAMYDLCIKNGMNAFRAWYCYETVKRFGDYSVDPKNKRPTLVC